MNDLLQSVANYGFPMAAAAYLLVRLDKRLASLEAAVHSLARAYERGYLR